MGLSSNPSHTTLQNYKKPNYQSVFQARNSENRFGPMTFAKFFQ